MILPPKDLSGTGKAAITIRALHDGKVTIDGEGKRRPVSLSDGNSWFVLEGFNAHVRQTRRWSSVAVRVTALFAGSASGTPTTRTRRFWHALPRGLQHVRGLRWVGNRRKDISEFLRWRLHHLSALPGHLARLPRSRAENGVQHVLQQPGDCGRELYRALGWNADAPDPPGDACHRRKALHRLERRLKGAAHLHQLRRGPAGRMLCRRCKQEDRPLPRTVSLRLPFLLPSRARSRADPTTVTVF